ncbi:MAG: hypothetical protein QM831_00325 [Kofleriaceae bacterium]
MRLTSLIAFSALALIACGRSDDDNSNPDAGSNGSNGSDSFNKIQDVQNDAMTPGTPVSLHNVVVTAIDKYGSKTGDIWVEEQGGGKRSGVHVYNAQLTDVASLNVGDVIDLKGAIKAEFALTGSNADSTGRTETELEPANGGQITITKSGMTATITPDKVDALAIGMMYDGTMAAMGGGTAFSNAWEDWEGVLIEIDNVSALNAASCVGKSCTDATLREFGLTGVINAESAIGEFAADDTTIRRGSCMKSVTGVVSYFYDYLIYSRGDADVVAGGTSCPATETACGDSIDNDGNGFMDCADFSCVASSNSCSTAITINSIDVAGDANPAAPVLPTGASRFESVCVTATAASGDMALAQAGTAAADQGLYLFANKQGLPAGAMVGSLVTAAGTVQAFKRTGSTAPEPQIELNAVGSTVVTGSCTVVPLAVAQTAAQMTVDATGHKYLGTLVTLSSANGGKFKVTTANGTGQFGKFTQGATVFSYYNEFMPTFSPAVNTCYTDITGMWGYDTNTTGSYELYITAGTAAADCN